MKTKFRKLTLMARESQRRMLTQSMQELGLLHIAQDTRNFPEDTEALIHERSRVKRFIRLLESHVPDENIDRDGRPEEILLLLQGLQELEEKLESAHQEIEKLEKKTHHLRPWGEYDFQKFKPFIEQGLHIYLCRSDQKTFEKLDRNETVIEKITQYGSMVYFMVITEQADYHAPFEYFALPSTSPAALRHRIQDLLDHRTTLQEALRQQTGHLPWLKEHLHAIEDAISLTDAQASFDAHFDGKLVSISAWFPVQQEQKVVQFVEKALVAWLIRDPQKDERVPVVLNNPKYPRLFEPITKVFDLPNYYETDLTPFLAVFYPILFAYCLGDSGYGFVLTALMVAGYFSFLKASRNIALLGIILGVVTMIVGLIKSGSLFGIALLPDHPAAWIRQLSAWVIITDDSDMVFNAFNVALMIGVLQILTGIIVSIYNKFRYEGPAYALSPIGKLLIVSSLIWIFLADMQAVRALDVMGEFRSYMLAAGITLVVFFHDIALPVIKRVGGAILPLFFIFTGILGDILSYVRLFALGLASSVLGLVVNQIGMQIMSEGFISIVIGVVFLLFGHTLNFGIAALGSFVHPLRLTFVEFYGNVGFQGKGLEYRPLIKSKHVFN